MTSADDCQLVDQDLPQSYVVNTLDEMQKLEGIQVRGRRHLRLNIGYAHSRCG